MTTYHSSYAIDHSRAPAPLLIANGWTDDLFPVDEALRFYNRTTTQYPRAPVSLFFLDFGHPRAQNKAADQARYVTAIHRWLDFYLKGRGRKPFQGVEALTETCPASAPSAGPLRASTWARLAPGEVRTASPAAQTILPDAGSAAIGATFNPIGAAACATAPGAIQPGTATAEVPAGAGFTLVGAPTVVADITLPGAGSQVAARLLDVGRGRARDPGRPRALAAEGLGHAGAAGLPAAPGGLALRPGPHVKLELLPDDAPYGRASNDQQPVTVSRLQLRLPTADRPGAAGGLVRRPAPKVVPRGYRLAREFARAR